MKEIADDVAIYKGIKFVIVEASSDEQEMGEG